MSGKKIIGWLTAVVIIGLSAVALWILREPLEQGVGVLTNRARPEATVRFAVIGDNHGVTAVYRQAIKEIADQPVDFLLNLADTSEFGTRPEFEDVRELEKTLPFPVYHTIGNHDIKTDPTGQRWSDTFSQLPDQAITAGNVHLIILNNANRKVGFSESTLTWLEDDLAKHQDKKIVLAYHRPFDLPLAAVLGDDETSASRQSNERFLSIINRHQIAYILTSHVHTFLEYAVGDIPAVVSGGGGDPAQTILGGPSANYFHYLVFTVKGKAVTYELHRLQL